MKNPTFKQLSKSTARDLEIIMNMNLHEDFERADDVRQTACVYVLRGKPWDVALRYARAKVARDYAPSAFVSLDVERDEQEDFSFHEKLAARDPVENADILRELNRNEEAESAVERVIKTVADGARGLGEIVEIGVSTLSKRRKQQVLQRNIEKIERANRFKNGGKGMGDMFGWGA
jgi:hypothetical protein